MSYESDRDRLRNALQREALERCPVESMGFKAYRDEDRDGVPAQRCPCGERTGILVAGQLFCAACGSDRISSPVGMLSTEPRGLPSREARVRALLRALVAAAEERSGIHHDSSKCELLDMRINFLAMRLHEELRP